MHLLLGLTSYLVFALLAPFLLFYRKLAGGRRERFGHYRGTLPAYFATPPIWMHGASAGDILALLPTARAFKLLQPNTPIVVSTLTDSGHGMAKKHAAVFDHVIYSPWDLPHVTRRAMRRIGATVLVLEYTELWPQLLMAANAQGVQVVLQNGRFGKARLGRYRLLFLACGNLLRRLNLLLLRDEHERERALALGARPQATHVTGNTKFDNVADGPSEANIVAFRAVSGFAEGMPVWAAGSTHEGEEEELLRIHLALRASVPGLRLLLAPRYPDRAAKLGAMATRMGLRARLRIGTAEWPEGGRNGQKGTTDRIPAPDVFILNSLGELRTAYATATAVFVGGSFVPRGGQNILEPAACGRPVLFGPSMDNFVDSVAVLLGRGGVQVASMAQLQRVLLDWLQAPERCRDLGALARAQVLQVRGAAARNAQYICDAYRAAPARKVRRVVTTLLR